MALSGLKPLQVLLLHILALAPESLLTMASFELLVHKVREVLFSLC